MGENRIKDLGSACKNLNIKKPLLVTDSGLAKSDIIQNVLSDLKKNGIPVELYSNVIGNPTGTNVNEGVKTFKSNEKQKVFSFFKRKKCLSRIYKFNFGGENSNTFLCENEC